LLNKSAYTEYHPKSHAVISIDVPPLLTKGNVNPVTGTKLTETAMLANAWITMFRQSPIANAQMLSAARHHRSI
jgi:hypothetical protein